MFPTLIMSLQKLKTSSDMKKKTVVVSITIVFSLIIAWICNAQTIQPRFTVNGILIDAMTSKPLRKIPIYILPFKKTIETNAVGKFLFDMPQGVYQFAIDYYPFEKKEVDLILSSDTSIVIKLYSSFQSQFIEEIEVVATKSLTEVPSSLERIDQLKLLKIPALIGEKDILKAFQLTSGVTSSSEGAADLQVRGGSHGQNLYLLDGVPLYSTQHFFGLVSAYNPLTIKNAKLYKADFPSEFGGKTSAIVDVLTKDANLKKVMAEAEISLLTTKAFFNIPVFKNKLAVSLSGRISNYSVLNLMALNPIKQDTKLTMGFNDVNANITWKIDENNNLRLNYFANADGIDILQPDRTTVTQSWINNSQQNTGLKWNYKKSDKSSNELFVFTDKYVFDYGFAKTDESINFKYIKQIITGINSSGISEKFMLNISDKLKSTFGGSLKVYGIAPILLQQSDSSINRINFNNIVSKYDGALFSELKYEFVDKQIITAGLRLSTFGNSDTVFTYLEPRVSYQGIFSNKFSVSASASRMTQTIHRVANPGLGVPFEIFLSSDKNLSPQTSWNYSLGIAKDLTHNNAEISVKADAWYKYFQNIVDFKDGYDVLMVMRYKTGITNNSIDIITQGKGYAYGLDISANYTKKRLSISADYSLMRVNNQFDELNNGKWFPSNTDIRHSVSLTGEYRLSPNWSVNSTWQFRSAKPITVPTRVITYPTNNFSTGELDILSSNYQLIETERNNYRTKVFHKLDISFLHTYKAFRKYNASISFGLYNVYNRANPFLYFISEEENKSGVYIPVLKSMSLFPILPSFSWWLKF